MNADLFLDLLWHVLLICLLGLTGGIGFLLLADTLAPSRRR